MRPVWERTDGIDGFVSLEVDPTLAYDRERTFEQAVRFNKEVDKPNLYVKIPATEPGLGAIEDCIAKGVPINVTLIFSLERYAAVVEAYLRGLERLVASGGDPRKVISVASFFVSRVDTEADKRLEAIGRQDLQGKLAIANAKLAYEHYLEVFGSDRWAFLAGKGARTQRCLWASTSTKNPSYRDVLYVEELIGPDTVNTMPLETVRAFQDHGEVKTASLTAGRRRGEGAPRRPGRGRCRLRRRRRDAGGRGRAEVRRLLRGAAGRDPGEGRHAAAGVTAAANPLLDGLQLRRRPEPCAVVIFGASGDLTKRKLIPALYALAFRKLLPEQFAIVGVARSPQSSAQFAAAMKKAVKEYARDPFRQEVWDSLVAGMRYVGTEFVGRRRRGSPRHRARGGRRGARYGRQPPLLPRDPAARLHGRGDRDRRAARQGGLGAADRGEAVRPRPRRPPAS